VVFLRNYLDVVSDSKRNDLAQVIAVYQEELDVLRPPSFERKGVFLGPWTGKSQADWTPEIRQREQELLLRATKIEAAAVETIKTII